MKSDATSTNYKQYVFEVPENLNGTAVESYNNQPDHPLFQNLGKYDNTIYNFTKYLVQDKA